MRRAVRASLWAAALVSLAVVGAYAAARRMISAREPDSLDTIPPEMIPGRRILVDGHRVHIVEQGTGPPLLLVHGFAASTYDWEQHALAPLSETHRVIAVDLWGMGFSDRREAFDYRLSSFAEELAGVLDALAIERASVAGHSLGGAIAAVFAARHPDRVQRLVLIAALAPSRLSETPWIFLGMLTPVVGEVGFGLADNLAPPYAPSDYRARMVSVSRIRGSRNALLRYVRRPHKFRELLAAYPAIRAPTLLLHGTVDTNVPYAAMQRVVPMIRDARVVPAEGKGHWLLWEAPEFVVAEMRAFLSGG